MNKGVVNAGPTDSNIESEIEECMSHVNRLRELKKQSPKAFDAFIKEFKLIAQGERKDPTAPVSQEMAESILIELNVIDPITDSRDDIQSVLGISVDDEYMGNEKLFISYEEAIRTGEFAEDWV